MTTRFLLDTNVISDVTKPLPSARLIDWMNRQKDDDLLIASLTIAEIRRGILQRPDDAKRRDLDTWFSGPRGPQALFYGRILPFDVPACLIWARLMADGKARGRPRNGLDMILAATAEAHGCIVVTDNEKDFAGLPFINPLRAP